MPDDTREARAVEDTTEKAIYDEALEMLWESAVADTYPDRPFYKCPGCVKLVDRKDTRSHARSCAELRALAVAELKEADDYRPEGR